jgi:hypothetical protein
MPLLSKPAKPKWYPLSTRFGDKAPDCWGHFIKDFEQIKLGVASRLVSVMNRTPRSIWWTGGFLLRIKRARKERRSEILPKTKSWQRLFLPTMEPLRP